MAPTRWWTVLRSAALLALCVAAQGPSDAATKSVTLSIPTMDCATCPLIIKTALLRLHGVTRARVSYEHREARVTFDDALVTVTDLTNATAAVGYPALLSDGTE
jgi:mercuric ion binding protein